MRYTLIWIKENCYRLLDNEKYNLPKYWYCSGNYNLISVPFLTVLTFSDNQPNNPYEAWAYD